MKKIILNMEKKWKELSIKDKLAYSSAITAMIVGFALIIASFIMYGSIGTGLIGIMGEILIYSASIFTLTKYFSNKIEITAEQISKYFKDNK